MAARHAPVDAAGDAGRGRRTSRRPGAGATAAARSTSTRGATDEARRLAWRVMRSMPGDAPIVVNSAGCGAAMKDYGRLLGTDAAARVQRARARLLGVARRATGAVAAHDRRRRSWCRTRATSATCSARTVRCARCWRRPTRSSRPTTTDCAAVRAARTRCCNPSCRRRSATARWRALRRRRRPIRSSSPRIPGCIVHLRAGRDRRPASGRPARGGADRHGAANE